MMSKLQKLNLKVELKWILKKNRMTWMKMKIIKITTMKIHLIKIKMKTIRNKRINVRAENHSQTFKEVLAQKLTTNPTSLIIWILLILTEINFELLLKKVNLKIAVEQPIFQDFQLINNLNQQQLLLLLLLLQLDLAELLVL